MDGGNQVAVWFIDSLPGVAGVYGHAGNEVGAGKIGIGENVGTGGDRSEAAKRVVSIRHGRTGGYAIANRVTRCAAERVVGAGDSRAVLHFIRELAKTVVCIGVRRYATRDGENNVAEAVARVGDIGRRIGIVDRNEVVERVVDVSRNDSSGPGSGRKQTVGRICVGWSFSVSVDLVRDETRGFVVKPSRNIGVGLVVGPEG